MPTSQIDVDQTQPPHSALYTVWNLIADLNESLTSKEDLQQQIVDLYGKVAANFPRLVCLVQLFLNCMQILEQVADLVVSSAGDSQNSTINENFIRNVESIIKKDYHKYDKSYLSSLENSQEVLDPMIIVGKEAVLIGWQLFDCYLNIATKLLTIDYAFESRSKPMTFSGATRQKTLKQLIMYFDFDIFPISAISVKHPTTGQTYVK